jgi:hypothetical protein
MSHHNRIRLVLCFALSIAGGTAQAYDGWGYAFPWFGYGNNGPAAYALGNIPAPPYFALHPPVYYSHMITPRSYGRSPFACPCNCHHGGRPIAAARIMANPLIQIKPTAPAKESESNAKAAVAVAAVPTRITNPFYSQPEGVLAQASN